MIWSLLPCEQCPVLHITNQQLTIVCVVAHSIRDCVREDAETRTAYWESDWVGHKTGRKLRTSVIYTRHEQLAEFGQTIGYERPLYFHSASVLEEEGFIPITRETRFQGNSNNDCKCLPRLHIHDIGVNC